MKTLFRTKRKAVAMIELIFSIVIMGIVMLSAPLMISTASQSSSVTFQQESIAIAATHTNFLMTYAWDEKNTESYKNTFGDLKKNILTVTNGDSELNTRIPNIARILDLNISSAIGVGDATDTRSDDIDDFHNTTSSLTLANGAVTAATSSEDNYMDINISLRTQVYYFDDTADYNACGSTANGCAFTTDLIDANNKANTNIKRIKVTLTSINVPDKSIQLNAFMCNIGAGKPAQLEGY